jgi:hypothetical protein
LFFGLNQFGVFLQNSQIKSEKKKGKEKEKGEEGRWQRFGLEPEMANGPASSRLNRYSHPLLFYH